MPHTHTHTHTHTTHTHTPHTHIAPIQPPQLQYDAGSSGRSEPLCYPQALSNLEQDRQGFEGGRELVEEGGREGKKREGRRERDGEGGRRGWGRMMGKQWEVEEESERRETPGPASCGH